MAKYGPLGGVTVPGFISTTDTEDEYAVLEPRLGIDGLRNIEGNETALNDIPSLRRRAGMVVGVNEGANHYKLLPEGAGWTYTFADWTPYGTNPLAKFAGVVTFPLPYPPYTPTVQDIGFIESFVQNVNEDATIVVS